MHQSYFSHQVDLNIRLDTSTSLPLYSEQQKILELVMNYSPLPYSISEYGCSKKSSIMIQKLIELGIPFYAIKRGMIMESDLSPKMLKEKKIEKRPHALTVENILYHKVEPDNHIQQTLLEEGGISLDPETGIISTGGYLVSHNKTVQFIQARSHIFPIVTFWDDQQNRMREMVIDPTLDGDEFFLISQLRKYLHASEAYIFIAHLFGAFKLVEEHMTPDQYKKYQNINPSLPFEKLTAEDFAATVRLLVRAEPQSIGDPQIWTYENNLPPSDLNIYEHQKQLTGLGDSIETWLLELKDARRKMYDEKVVQLVHKINNYGRKHNFLQLIITDAKQAEKELKPLKRLVDIVSTSIALRELKDRLIPKNSLYQDITEKRGLNLLYGLSFRLRERIEMMARISRNQQGAIDAQALNDRFILATIALIKQMNRAGLKVFIDQVGNIHGLLLDQPTFQRIQNEPELIRTITAASICHASHIDTVIDAGKYDGRLGVLSGIEVADILKDLQRFFEINTIFPRVAQGLFVTAFVGEEMTFTGQGISMPGSAAVAGHARIESVYRMTNQKNEPYRERLIVLLKELHHQKQKGKIDFVNPLNSSDALIPEKYFDPKLFFSRHTYERHIEQGDFLHGIMTPMVLVDAIMGIHQEDFHFKGIRAEDAALEFNIRLRDLILHNKKYEDLRLTGGIFDTYPDPDKNEPIKLTVGMRWTLEGERDHAGATRNENRRDAGVACGRLISFTSKLIKEYNRQNDSNIHLHFGGIEFWPGVNRNVIPGRSSVTIGMTGAVSKEQAFYFQQQISAYIAGRLSLPVKSGGEGTKSFKIHEVHYLNKSEDVNFSLDLRCADQDLNRDFLLNLDKVLKELILEFDVEVKRKIEQRLDPYHLNETGQILQIERSYGGSHNPNETQLARDVLRGLLIQLAVSLDYIKMANINDFNLFKFVNKKLPMAWKERCPNFISGALHDTCNISKAISG